MTPVAPRYRAAGLTDTGFVRGNNEDRVYSDDVRGIFLVVDGMGGQEAGEHAAEIAVERIRARLERQTGTAEQRIREAIALANNAIFEAAQSTPDWKGMACVLTVALIEEGQVTIGHVGDSRLYRIKRGRIEKITHDHSPVGEREDNGEITEAEAMQHPRRNEVFRDAGSEEHAPDDENFIEILRIPFEPDGALLLCSDGLSDALSSQEILAIVERNAGDRWAAVRALVGAATEVGKDNVSAVLVEGEKFAASFGKRAAKRALASRPGDGETTGRLGPAAAAGTVAKPPPGAAGPGAASRGGDAAARQTDSSAAAGAGAAPKGPGVTGIGAAARRPEQDSAALLALTHRPWYRSAPAFFLYGLVAGAALLFAAGKFFAPKPPPERSRTLVVTAPDSIAAALQRALPGDTVSVAPGTYPESIRLQSGVDVIAQRAHDAIIGGEVVADGITSGRLEGFQAHSVRVHDSDVVIERDEISGSAGPGIEFSGTARGAIAACWIHDNAGPGILVTGSASPAIENNLIVSNGAKPGAASPGLLIQSTVRLRVTANIFLANSAEPIWLPAADQETIARNYFTVSGKPDKRPKFRVIAAPGSRP